MTNISGKIKLMFKEVIDHAVESFYHNPQECGWMFHPMLNMTDQERDQLFTKLAEVSVTIDKAIVAVILVKQQSGGVLVQPEYPKNISKLMRKYPNNPVYYFQ